MPTRNVVVTDHQAKLIEKLVSSGRYQNASEVLREGLRMIEMRDETEEAKLQALRAAVQLGIDDMEAGRYRTFESFDEMNEYLHAITEDIIHPKKVTR